MKSKMRRHAQPRERAHLRNEEARREIVDFLKAIDSYPARAVKDPRLSFQQHLCSIFSTSPARSRRRA
jgi:hypothetical protein